MIRWLKKNWLYFAILFIVIALAIVLCVVNDIDILYLVQNPSPEFITAICVMIVVILYLIVFLINNTKEKLWSKKHFGKN